MTGCIVPEPPRALDSGTITNGQLASAIIEYQEAIDVCRINADKLRTWADN